LAKGDNSRLIMLYAKDMLISSTIIFARWQHASRSWSWGEFDTPILREGEVVARGSQWW